jgi:hypothetical protein
VTRRYPYLVYYTADDGAEEVVMRSDIRLANAQILMSEVARVEGSRPKAAALPQLHAALSTSVSWGTSSLPFVSGLNSSVMTNTTAAPDVAISIGMAKPSGWPKAK